MRGGLTSSGSTEHWGPNDELAQEQQDIRSVRTFETQVK